MGGGAWGHVTDSPCNQSVVRGRDSSHLVNSPSSRQSRLPSPPSPPRQAGAARSKFFPPMDFTVSADFAGIAQNDFAESAKCQNLSDCTKKYIVKNYFYYYLFRFSAALGEEIFYITFLPFTCWNINHCVSRRMIIVVMYIGQVSKDILKWPRPHSPPVVKLEVKADAEYGMPSTHAMAATAISFTFFIVTVNQYKVGRDKPVLNYIDLFFFYSFILQDVIGGTLISAVLLALSYPAWDLIDHFLLTSPFCPVFSIVVPLLLCYNYPKLDYYSPTRGDTTTILGAGAGAIIGFWLTNQYTPLNSSSETFQLSFPPISSKRLMVMLAKFLVGVFVLLITRQFIRRLALSMLYYWYKVSTSDEEARKRLEIEVPYKFITYSSVGFSSSIATWLIIFIGFAQISSRRVLL
uniref:Sphingosine-1-phosphate phosphatase 2 n=1 Tax=Crocodylus porosus TaxID=8502 RepID=A0A7M4FTJ0_CROPO